MIETATGRRVIGFMSGNQQDPDIMCEVFILAPTDLVDDHEMTERRGRAGAGGASAGRLTRGVTLSGGGHDREVGVSVGSTM